MKPETIRLSEVLRGMTERADICFDRTKKEGLTIFQAICLLISGMALLRQGSGLVIRTLYQNHVYAG